MHLFLLINLRFDIIYAFYLTGTRYFALNSSQKNIHISLNHSSSQNDVNVTEVTSAVSSRFIIPLFHDIFETASLSRGKH